MQQQFYAEVHRPATDSLRAIVQEDENAAQDVVTRRASLWKPGTELLMQLAGRLAEDDPDRRTKHRIQVDALDRLRRIYGVAGHMAIRVLPEGVLAGELAV